MSKIISALALALTLVLVAACAQPASGLPLAAQGTMLRKIQDRGKLIVGVKYDTPSFGLVDQRTGRVDGMDADIAREIAMYIFGDSSKIEFKEAVTENRIPFLKDGTVDVILATFTITEDRLKDVDCSIVYYVQGQRLLVSKDSSIQTMGDLDGKKIAVKKGSGAVDIFTKQTAAQVVQVANYDEQLKLLQDQKVDAINGNDITLYGFSLDHPAFKVVGPQFSREYIGAAIAKGHSELLQVVNTVIKNMKSSGKWKAIWKADIGDKFGIATIPEPPDDEADLSPAPAPAPTSAPTSQTLAVAPKWSVQDGAPVVANITGGPWTLAQMAPGNPNPPAIPNKTFGYDSNWMTANLGKTSPMQPYYFPMTQGDGNNLQGYFDWRPKDINEAIVAAKSTDGGKTWQHQQTVLTLTRALPVNPQSTNPDADQLDNGFGHPFVMQVGNSTLLYTLDRSNAALDNFGLVVSNITPDNISPLNNALASIPLFNPTTTDEAKVVRTKGLLNPDGIIGVVPGSSPVKVMYVQKIKGGDNTSTTAFPASQQCGTQPYIPSGDTKPRPANHDIVYVRLATTTDGIDFSDLGAVSGLNDATATAYNATRYIGPRGAMLKLQGDRYGLFFSGGNCMDADSDAFHYIGYAETNDPSLKTWTVINGINNPIASIGSQRVPVGDTQMTIPAQTPIVGAALDWFKGRVYSPSVTRYDDSSVVLVFAGYQVQTPNNDLLHYRTIGYVKLRSNR
jgi:ABC-type amino acid transport substrate-binding protein